MRDRVLVGSRASALAMWQTNWVVQELSRLYPGLAVQILPIKTEGDLNLDTPLPRLGGKGIFVNEIENALLCGTIDLAVHSLKDLPTEQPEELAISAVPKRADARDALVSRSGLDLASLPPGATVGTSSLRRSAQLLAARPDLRMANLRGNVDTRLRKAVTDFDAIVVAVAGLLRLGMAGRITAVLPVDVCTPAVGQGALAVETRAGDDDLAQLVAPLDDPETRAAVEAERALLHRLGGGCHVPVGGYAYAAADKLVLVAVVADPSGRPCFRRDLAGVLSNPVVLGQHLADLLLDAGADVLLGRR